MEFLAAVARAQCIRRYWTRHGNDLGPSRIGGTGPAVTHPFIQRHAGNEAPGSIDAT